MKLNKKLLMFGIPILALGLVVAGWVIFYSPSSSGFEITSNEPILFSDNFEFTPVDVTNSSAEKIEKITITNVDSERNLNVSIETLYVDLDTDSCIVQPYDFEVIVNYENGIITQIYDGDIIVVPKGVSNISVSTSVLRDSCSGNLSTELTLEGV